MTTSAAVVTAIAMRPRRRSAGVVAAPASIWLSRTAAPKMAIMLATSRIMSAASKDPVRGGRSRRPVGLVYRQGKLLSRLGSPEYSSWPQLSPDGKRLAIRLLTAPADAFDIWIYDLTRGVHARMSFSALTAYAPVWSPDGTRLAYAHSAAQVSGDHIYLLNADGTGKEQFLEQPVIESIANYPSSWSPDGHVLLFDHQGKTGKVSHLDFAVRCRSQVLLTSH